MSKQSKLQKPAEKEAGLTRGHKKKARTRKALVEAAIRIYAQKGVGELLLKELAEEAEMASGTVYNYFKTKDDVLYAVASELANQLSESITAASEGVESGAERVAIGIRVFILQGRKDPVWASAIVRVFQYDKGMRTIVGNNLRADLQLGVEQGIFKYDQEDVAMMFVASSTVGAMGAILDGIDDEHYDVLVAKMVMLGLGVTPAKASRIARLNLPELPIADA